MAFQAAKVALRVFGTHAELARVAIVFFVAVALVRHVGNEEHVARGRHVPPRAQTVLERIQIVAYGHELIRGHAFDDVG
jgi:hypothetical protein